MFKKIFLSLLTVAVCVPFTGQLSAAPQSSDIASSEVATNELAWHGGWGWGGWRGGYGGWGGYGGGWRYPYYGGGYYGGYYPYYRSYYYPYYYRSW